MGMKKGKNNNKINRGDRGMVRNGGYGRRENEEVGGVVGEGRKREERRKRKEKRKEKENNKIIIIIVIIIIKI